MPEYQGRGLGVTIQDRIGRDSYSELANSEHDGDSRQRELHVAKGELFVYHMLELRATLYPARFQKW